MKKSKSDYCSKPCSTSSSATAGSSCSSTSSSSSTATGKKVTFSFSANDAKQVMLAGDFNNWDYNKTSLKKGKDNVWKTELSLKAGRYEYKFVVDGSWVVDPKNPNSVWNSLGAENSVIEVC